MYNIRAASRAIGPSETLFSTSPLKVIGSIISHGEDLAVSAECERRERGEITDYSDNNSARLSYEELGKAQADA